MTAHPRAATCRLVRPLSLAPQTLVALSLAPLSLAALTALCLVAGVAGAVQDEAALAREEIGAQLEELGTTLKAAVFSGALTGEEARGIYGRVARATKARASSWLGCGRARAPD